MIFTKSQIYKLLFITLALCCLTSDINARRLPRSQTTTNATDIAASAKAEIDTTTATPALKHKTNKASTDDDEEDNDDTAAAAEPDDDDDDDDDDEEEEDVKQAAEKNAVQPAADSSLSVWGIVRGLWNWIKDDISESLFGADEKSTSVGEGRTFGKIRRLQMALIPIVFKFGVLSAMVAFLVAIGIKTLFLVKVLVVMNLLAILAKFFTLKTNFGHEQHVAPTWGWTPYVNHGWQSAPVEHHNNKEIHLHIHGGGHGQPQVSGYSYGNSAVTGHSSGWERRNDPYSAYDNIALQGAQSELVANDLVSEGSAPNGQYNGNFPSNHRML